MDGGCIAQKAYRMAAAPKYWPQAAQRCGVQAKAVGILQPPAERTCRKGKGGGGGMGHPLAGLKMLGERAPRAEPERIA